MRLSSDVLHPLICRRPDDDLSKQAVKNALGYRLNLAVLRSARLTRRGPNIEFTIARMCIDPVEFFLAK
jgi:hypothetical protein